MLRPALLYKEKLLQKFTEYLYTKDYFWYTGTDCGSQLPKIVDEEGLYQFVCVDPNDNIIGFFSYRIERNTDTAYAFGVFSFDRGNPILGVDMMRRLEFLIKRHHKVTWCVIEGNPVKRHYDKFCKKHKGHISHMFEETIDLDGKYRDSYMYEIINGRDLSEVDD